MKTTNKKTGYQCTLAFQLKKLYHFKVFHVAKTPAPSLEKRRYAFSMPNTEITLSIPRMKPDEVRVLCRGVSSRPNHFSSDLAVSNWKAGWLSYRAAATHID